MVEFEVLLARAYLSRVAEPACVPLWGLVRKHGPVEAAERIRTGDVADDLRRATEARARFDAHADLEAAERHGIRLVTPESDEWPHFAFAALEATSAVWFREYEAGRKPIRDEGGAPITPPALWVRGVGDLETLAVRSAAMVGARAATSYGEHVTAELAYGLATRDVVIVSGGAYGIDAAAHRAALAADGVTVLVSAGGLDRPYPPSNASLYERAAATGLVISESPPGAAPQRGRFLSRNRLIAAFGTGTVVVEAALRSGAKNTAMHARNLGRPLMAVPGPVTSPMSAGCHDLIRREEARLVTSVGEILELVGSVGEGPQPRAGGDPDALRAALDSLDPTSRRVFDGLLPRKAIREEELAYRAGVGALDVVRALPMLRLVGLVESTETGYRISAAFRRTTRAAHGGA